MSNDAILIVATSGRMLAQSARRAGLSPLVIDLFADLDTQEIAQDVRAVRHLGPSQLSPVIDHYINRYDVRDVVYGSGVEFHPETLRLLGRNFHLKGNRLENVCELLDKQKFFQCLKELNIHYPEVSFDPVDQREDWLLKPLAGEGGFGIKHLGRTDRERQLDHVGKGTNPFFWQRYVDGIPMSALFLADGKNMQIVGFNRQWTRKEGFLFSGVINQSSLPGRKHELVRRWVEQLVQAFALKGLNSLDFIWDGSRSWVLEINPRPSASMVLYDDKIDKGLLSEHLRACDGRPFNFEYKPKDINAWQILYAETTLRVPAGIRWPDWSMDRTEAGTLIRNDQPICSIIASGSRPQEVYNQLQARQQIMINKLIGKQ